MYTNNKVGWCSVEKVLVDVKASNCTENEVQGCPGTMRMMKRIPPTWQWTLDTHTSVCARVCMIFNTWVTHTCPWPFGDNLSTPLTSTNLDTVLTFSSLSLNLLYVSTNYQRESRTDSLYTRCEELVNKNSMLWVGHNAKLLLPRSQLVLN